MHDKQYRLIPKQERYMWLKLANNYMSNLRKHLKSRIQQESSIPAGDIKEAILQIIEHPTLGGRKGSLKLLEDEKALIGETFYKEIKKSLQWLSEVEYGKRKEESELKKNKEARVKNDSYFPKVISKGVNDVWAIDYVHISIFGMMFYSCIVYDLFSQSHISIEADNEPSVELAKLAVNTAFLNSGSKPKRFILSDNGKQFLCEDYIKLLEKNCVSDKQIPAGKPWYNGSLESCNRDLKKTIYTHVAYEACKNIEITKNGVVREDVLLFLKECCKQSWVTQNFKIPRTKFNTTPGIVVKGLVEESQLKKDQFKKNKLKERKQTKEYMKKGKVKRRNGNFCGLVKASWNQISRDVSTEKLYAFTELINGRYSFVTK